MTIKTLFNASLGLMLSCLYSMPVHALDPVEPGRVIVEPPTLEALGIEWPISGDDNRNASVRVEFRQAGTAAWREGLPLLRLQNEYSSQFESIDYHAPNMFAGSLFDLEPDTVYDIRLTLHDPDGVEGAGSAGDNAERRVQARTRAEPQPARDGRVLHVYPPGHDGPTEQPAYFGLLDAFYVGANAGDWNNSAPPRVGPGDIIEVHAGLYRDPQSHYSHELVSGGTTCCTTTWDGTYYLTTSGTAERPIVIRAAGDGEVIFDGNDNEVLFNIMAADHLYFEGLTFRNTRHAILAGRKNILGAEGLTVRHNRFEDVGIGIHTDYSGSRNFYIADNVFIGRHDPAILTGWLPEVWQGSEQPHAGVDNFESLSAMRSYYAVKVYGQGHVITHNAVRDFHDGITHATYGNPDNWPDTPRERLPVSIDITNNDISNMHDNCIEADGSVHNIRILRNRCFNSATGAYSFQPVLGGPVYFVRNVAYHALGGIIKAQANPSGIVHYNNTYIGAIWHLTQASNLHYRNNLLLGQQRRPALFELHSNTAWSSSDFNGFRPNADSDIAFIRNAPETNAQAPVRLTFPTLATYAGATGQDRNSILVDYSIFVDADMPDLEAPTRVYETAAVDLRLRADAVAIDAGTVLPGVTDDFNGAAPDLGAYEYGAPLPHYGPRPGPQHNNQEGTP